MRFQKTRCSSFSISLMQFLYKIIYISAISKNLRSSYTKWVSQRKKHLYYSNLSYCISFYRKNILFLCPWGRCIEFLLCEQKKKAHYYIWVSCSMQRKEEWNRTKEQDWGSDWYHQIADHHQLELCFAF